MGFPITTGTIVVIIDYDWVYYFLYFFIFLLYFSRPIKPPLSRKRVNNLSYLFPLFGFSKWKSIFRVIRSVIKLLQLKTKSNQRDYRTSDLAAGAIS